MAIKLASSLNAADGQVTISIETLDTLIGYIDWTTSPYMDERTREELEDDYPWLAGLLKARDEIETQLNEQGYEIVGE